MGSISSKRAYGKPVGMVELVQKLCLGIYSTEARESLHSKQLLSILHDSTTLWGFFFFKITRIYFSFTYNYFVGGCDLKAIYVLVGVK